jgi:hypothetical protein
VREQKNDAKFSARVALVSEQFVLCILNKYGIKHRSDIRLTCDKDGIRSKSSVSINETILDNSPSSSETSLFISNADDVSAI